MGRKQSRNKMDTNKIIISFLSLFLAAFAHAGTITPNLGLENPIVGDTDYPSQISNSLNTLDNAVCDIAAGCTFQGDVGTTGSFLGDGSFLTGVASESNFVKEDFTSLVDGATDTFAINDAPVTGSLQVYMDGLSQGEGIDWTLVSNIEVVFTTAPAADTNSLLVVYSTGSSSGGGGGGVNANAPILGIGTLGDPLRLDTSSVTLQGNTFNNPTQLVRLDGTSRLPAVDGSLLTNVIASGIAVNTKAPVTGNGLVSNPIGVDSSSVTLLGPSPAHSSLSGITASNHHIAYFTIHGSTSYPDSEPQAINSLSYIHIGTASLVGMRGGRPVTGYGSVSFLNSSGGNRGYTFRVIRDGVTLVSQEFEANGSNGNETSISISFTDNSATPGNHDYGLQAKSDNPSTTQETHSMHLHVIEY